MPTSAPKFSQKIRPFSDEFNRDMQQMAEAVRRMEAAFDIVYKKALEPSKPQSVYLGRGKGVVLRIDSASSIATNQWEYNVTEGTVDDTGAFTASSVTGVAFNTYEMTPFGHGQDLTLSEADLTVSECDGYVVGLKMEDGVYVFEATNPMVPTCTSTLVDGGTWS